MFDSARKKLAQWISPSMRTGSRMYAAARQSRLTTGWGQSNTSADSELVSSLRTLRARSRALVRDAAYAKRAKVIVVNNVAGSGIGMQAQVMTARGKLNAKINDEIEKVWEKWCRADSAHTGGTLHFSDLERAAVGQVFEAGEVFIRKHYQPFGASRIPYALELIESERIADEFETAVAAGPTAPGAMLRMGIESDKYHRPLSYLVRERHPGDLRFVADQPDRLERVPADQIIHLRLVDRWPQTRGEPWLHAVARKLNDMDGYSEAEITAARAAACYMGIIETSEQDSPLGAETKQDGTKEFGLEPAVVQQLNVGEKFNFVSPNRPNANMDPFMRMMLREVAAGCGVSYESLSRDYSQSNYSSSRLGLLDDRDLWRVLQLWMIRSFRDLVHREWLQQAILVGAIESIRVEQYAADPEKFEAVRYKPRGWSWVDPTKEVTAYKEAIRAGLTTVTDVIAATANGADVEDVLTTRQHELELMAEKGLKFDTDPAALAPPDNPAQPPPDPGDANQDEPTNNDPQKRVVSFQR